MKWMGGARQRLKIHERGAKRRLHSHSQQQKMPLGPIVPDTRARFATHRHQQRKESSDEEFLSESHGRYKAPNSDSRQDVLASKDLAFLEFNEDPSPVLKHTLKSSNRPGPLPWNSSTENHTHRHKDESPPNSKRQRRTLSSGRQHNDSPPLRGV
eukprot:gb/GECG01009405.1/.p1 GENE.gb/GECG01009405.1/~~gb/GECG01009405.1/.p1  ORF type:complete len:155 (+),score=20.14 gb/GECG01009405.1/:1-465(+)